MKRIQIHRGKKVFNVTYNGTTILVKSNTNLRQALLSHNLNPYNGNAKYINCRGLGTCGTCAVEIHPETTTRSRRERWRLNFPPHKESQPLRLACQVHVTTNLVVSKHNGFWGHKLKKTNQQSL